jgi:rod shape-determining protein MreD
MNHVRLNFFDVDLVTVIIAYLLITHGEAGTGIFAFGQGLLIDIFTAGPLGLFTLVYLMLFLGINFVGSRFFDLHTTKGQVIIIALAVFLKEVFVLIFLYISSSEIMVSSTILLAFAASAICSGLIGPLVFYFFNRLNDVFIGSVRGTSDETV